MLCLAVILVAVIAILISCVALRKTFLEKQELKRLAAQEAKRQQELSRIAEEKAIEMSKTMRKARKTRNAGNKDEFRDLLQSVAGSVYRAPVGHTYGKAKFVTIEVNTRRERLAAVKFKVPKGGPQDMIWTFEITGAQLSSWYMLPVRGDYQRAFRNFRTLDSGPPSIKILQLLRADRLKPGEDYILWFLFKDSNPTKITLAINCFPAGELEDHTYDMSYALGMIPPSSDTGTDLCSYDENVFWWYSRYLKHGDHNPKWDKYVENGIRHWMRASYKEEKTDFLKRTVSELQKALDMGSQCPITKFMYSRNRHVLLTNYRWSKALQGLLRESIASARKKPELQFIEFASNNILAWQLQREGKFKEAIQHFTTALAINHPDIRSNLRKDAEWGLKTSRDWMRTYAKEEEKLKTQKAIHLPENPTEEQARDYVKQVLQEINKNIISDDINEQRKLLLMRVGAKNLGILIEHLDYEKRGKTHRLVLDATVRTAKDENKELILRCLNREPELARIVVKRNWANDAKKTLLTRLAEQPSYLPPEWIEAIVQMRDPATYADLMNYYLNCDYPHRVYELLSTLPDFDLHPATVELWLKSATWPEGREGTRFASRSPPCL